MRSNTNTNMENVMHILDKGNEETHSMQRHWFSKLSRRVGRSNGPGGVGMCRCVRMQSRN